MVDWHQIGAVTGVTVAERAGDGLLILVKLFGEGGVQELHDGNVQAIQPEDRLLAWVAVVVPGHRWGDDEITLVHDGLFAVDGGVCAAAFQHEAQGGLGVAVGGRHFTGEHQLDAGVEVRGDAGLAAQARIFQHQNTALGFLGGDQTARLHHGGADVGEAPGGRAAWAARFRRDKVGERGPERGEVLLADLVVERDALRRVGGVSVHRIPPLC